MNPTPNTNMMIPNQNAMNPMPQQPVGFNQPQFRSINIVLVNSIEDARSYQMPPGVPVLFMDQSMTSFLMRSTDPNGFLLPDRTWSMTETTPKPTVPAGDYVTKNEFKELSDKIDKLVAQLA